tara:strand:+ start:184 stop:1188 length:1005 start_codon:yes stop_codon:yes gene_type:complete
MALLKSSQGNQDNIYLNITTDTINRTAFQFDANRVQAVLDKPTDYQLGVVRFSVPTNSIPLMNWRPDFYKIGIEFNGTLKEKYVDFIPNSNKGPLYPNTIGQLWSYQEYCATMSNCLKQLHDEMVLAEPSFPANKEILMKIEPSTSIISLYCQAGYADPAVKVYFNFNLITETVFQAFQETADLFRITIEDKKTNTTTYGGGGYIMSQEYPTTALISKLDKLIFETNSIPVNPELLGTSTNETRQVITDFNCSDFARDSLAIQYYPQGPVRHYDMNSHAPLNRIDLVVQWEDVYGVLYPIYLQLDDQISIKIHFRKKGQNIIQETLYHNQEINY